MSCPIKVNSNTIELTVQTSCYCILDLLCVIIKILELINGVSSVSDSQHLSRAPTEKNWIKSLKFCTTFKNKIFINLKIMGGFDEWSGSTSGPQCITVLVSSI